MTSPLTSSGTAKDQTFDRDLYAFRAFHEAGVISAAVLLTRSEELNEVFKKLGVMKKYGASTTWMGKLLIEFGRAGTVAARFWSSGSQEAHRGLAGMNEEAKNLVRQVGAQRFRTVLADPPWQFQNRTGKVAPEHRRLSRYGTLAPPEIETLPVAQLLQDTAHLYLWVPNALLPEGLRVLQAWGLQYKSNLVWHKVRKDGGPDGRGVGFYSRNTTELLLFGVRGKNVRTLAPGRRQVNILRTMKREHSRKPDEQYDLIENCSPGPFLELFARGQRTGWVSWGNQAEDYSPTWSTYSNHSQASVHP